MNGAKVSEALTQHVPEAARPYCLELWEKYHFKFVLKKKRHTVLGDYTYIPRTGQHVISINSDQNPYAFLVTYLHEVAHLATMLEYGNRVKPHGEEWKAHFKQLLYPLLKEEVFPPDVLIPLYHYTGNPKATSCSDPELLKAFAQYDDLAFNVCMLSDLKPGDSFRFQKRYFVKHSVKRSRAICKELTSRREYYIPLTAQVEVMQISIF